MNAPIDRRFRLMLVLLMILVACRTTPATCRYQDFSIGSSHMTNRLPTLFVVRELRGRFVPEFFDGEAGEWISQENTIRFQVNGPNGAVLSVPVAPDGRFHVPNLRPGTYCFHTASEGFQGYEGTIVIDPRAPAERVVNIGVALGA